MSKKEPMMCADCGGEAIPHRLTYITVAIDETLRPMLAPSALTHFFLRGLYALESRITPFLMKLMRKVGLARFEQAPDERTMLVAKVLWEEANVRGIQVHEVRLFGLPRNMFIAKLTNGARLCYEGIPMPAHSARQAWWLDNKGEMKKRFTKVGIPVPKGKAVFTEKGAFDAFYELSAPVIVKPYSGSGSRHTTLHIRDEETLFRAFKSAKRVAPLAVVEEELVGAVYRATVIDGVCQGVLRRDPPHVIATGAHNIRQLVAKANEHPARGGPYFSKIMLNSEALAELAWQRLSPIDMPEEGTRVLLHQKINWSVGGTTTDVTDVTHPENMALFERVAEVLQAPVVGIDFIISDITSPWQEQERCGVIECNSMPFFDNHHLPFEGEPRNVAGAVWDMVSKYRQR